MMHTVIHNAQPIIIQLYNESLQLFRLAADGHGYYLPPEQHRDRIRAWFDLRVRIEKCEPQEIAVPEPRLSALPRLLNGAVKPDVSKLVASRQGFDLMPEQGCSPVKNIYPLAPGARLRTNTRFSYSLWATALTATIIIITALLMLSGILIERWLFFAEAKHTVMLYY